MISLGQLSCSYRYRLFLERVFPRQALQLTYEILAHFQSTVQIDEDPPINDWPEHIQQLQIQLVDGNDLRENWENISGIQLDYLNIPIM